MAPAPHIKKTELARLLSKRGACSRKDAIPLVRSRAVKVNGKVITDPFAWVSINATLLVNDKAINSGAFELIMLHKPRGYVTTTSDEKGRKTVFDLLPPEYRSFKAVGRLDMATSGLLLFTNDTQLANYLTDPKNKIPRVYIAVVSGAVDESTVKKFCVGIIDDGELLKASSVEIKKASKRESTISITLLEGKNREIRRLCKALGHEVVKLKRISFGEYELEDLAQGLIRKIIFDRSITPKPH